MEETNFEESMKSREKNADELEIDDLDLETQVKKC